MQTRTLAVAGEACASPELVKGAHMDRATRLNIAYAVIAVAAVLALQSWWQAAGHVEAVPYSQFEQALADGRVAEVVITDTEVRGQLKKPDDKGRREIVAERVEPELAARLSRYDVPYRREMGNSLLRDALAWALPMLLFAALWLFLFRGAFADKQGPAASWRSARARPRSTSRRTPA